MKSLTNFLLFLAILVPVSAMGEYHKHLDVNGNVLLTDNLSKFLESQRPKAEQFGDKNSNANKFIAQKSQNQNVPPLSVKDLHRAASKGDIKSIKEVLSAGANVNAADESGLTALMYASYHGFKDTAEFLLESGANINDKDRQGKTPLMHACETNRLEIVKLLISKGSDVNAKARDGSTPLISAAARSGPDVVVLLLDHGADMNAKSSEGVTPLLHSLKYYDKKNALILISRGANVNDRDSEGRTPLFYAVIRGHKDVVEQLLEKGADINAKDNQGRTPLLYAPMYNHSTDIAKLLLSKGADKTARDKSGLTASMHAARLARPEFGELLSSNGYGITKLMTAAKNNDLNAIKQLIANGSDVNAKDTAGDSPLIYAIKAKQLNVANLLIKNGADVNSRNIVDMTPLMVAVIQNNREMIELLIDNGADLNARAEGMFTALMAAAMNRNKVIYNLLIAKGAKKPFTLEQAAAEPVEITEKTVKALWAGLCSAMLAGDIEKAVSYFVYNSQESYRRTLRELMEDKRKTTSIFSNHEGLVFDKNFKPGNSIIECGIIRNESGTRYSYPITFVRDLEGSWKINGF